MLKGVYVRVCLDMHLIVLQCFARTCMARFVLASDPVAGVCSFYPMQAFRECRSCVVSGLAAGICCFCLRPLASFCRVYLGVHIWLLEVLRDVCDVLGYLHFQSRFLG